MGERGLFAPALLVARPALTGFVPPHRIVGTSSCESTRKGHEGLGGQRAHDPHPSRVQPRRRRSRLRSASPSSVLRTWSSPPSTSLRSSASSSDDRGSPSDRWPARVSSHRPEQTLDHRSPCFGIPGKANTRCMDTTTRPRRTTAVHLKISLVKRRLNEFHAQLREQRRRRRRSISE